MFNQLGDNKMSGIFFAPDIDVQPLLMFSLMVPSHVYSTNGSTAAIKLEIACRVTTCLVQTVNYLSSTYCVKGQSNNSVG